MKSTLKDITIENCAGMGIYSNMEVDIDGIYIRNVGSDAIRLENREFTFEKWNLPPESNPKELAKLLIALQEKNKEPNQIIRESLFWKLLGRSADFIAVSEAILSISILPNVQEIIAYLSLLSSK